MNKNIFVFVVCGSKEHIETLHFSLNYLKRFSQNEIYIITDTTRNEISIKHDLIIDVNTPENFNHHQASIYLKTGLYKYLPKENNYCYTDTDIVALSSDCDAIFDEFIAPIRFASDHSRIRKFSSYAVNCGCLQKWQNEEGIIDKIDKTKLIKNQYIKQKAKDWKRVIEKFWIVKWLYNIKNNIWKNECDHLTEYICNTFKIKVIDKNWQHWNGGVFLFNDSSRSFLEAWHQKTMHIFTLPGWKTRDQGSLIATVWELDLQDHPVLDKKWNFLADYYNNPKVDFDFEGYFTDNNWKTKHKVNLIHIYHHFGDETWDLWNYIESVNRY